MKKLIPIFSLAVIMAACNSVPKTNTDTMIAGTTQQAPVTAVDTTGLASYQAWKAQNELADVNNYNQPAEPQKPIAKATKVKKTSKPHVSQPTPQPAALPSAPTASSENTTIPASDNSTASSGSGTTSVPAGETTTAEQKKGWSNKAKGAVIGGVVGAGAGAVINKKNPVLGAVIGGVIGAGGGYVIGGKMDKKEVKLPMAGIGL
jgi:hypothetical protein